MHQRCKKQINRNWADQSNQNDNKRISRTKVDRQRACKQDRGDYKTQSVEHQGVGTKSSNRHEYFDNLPFVQADEPVFFVNRPADEQVPQGQTNNRNY